LKKIILDLHPNLEDVKEDGKLKVPDKETMRKQFDKHVDVLFIKDMLINRVMDGEHIIDLCTYLIDTVKDLQASSRDNEVSAMWENMINNFRKQYISIDEFIPMFFEEMFKIIDKICSDVILLPIVKATTRIVTNDYGLGGRCM
jgi:hypothetical protein